MLCLCVWRISLRALSTEQGASIWITGARVIKIRADIVQREGNNIREDAMAEQIRLSLVLFASFHFIIEHLLGDRGKTDHSALSLFLQTLVTCSCDFNFTEFGQRRGNLIQLLAKTSSSMCILWTFQNFSEDLCQDVPRAKWRQGDIPNKWHLSGQGRTWGVMLAMNNGFLMKMSIYTRLECLARCQYLLFVGAGTIFVRISGLRI